MEPARECLFLCCPRRFRSKSTMTVLAYLPTSFRSLSSRLYAWKTRAAERRAELVLVSPSPKRTSKPTAGAYLCQIGPKADCGRLSRYLLQNRVALPVRLIPATVHLWFDNHNSYRA